MSDGNTLFNRRRRNVEFVVGIGITAYMFLVVPFLFGILEAGIFRKKEKSVSEIFVNGYLFMLAVFWLVAVVAIQNEVALSAFTKIYFRVTLALSGVGLVCGNASLKRCIIEIKDFWTKRNRAREAFLGSKWLLLMVCLVSGIISIGFTKPDSADETAEIVATAVQMDSMYGHDAYTGYLTGYVEVEKAFSPIEMLYAAGAAYADIEAGVFVYYLLPIALLIFFFLSMWRIGSVLFEKEEQRIQFELIIVGIYWMTTLMPKSSLVTGVFLNIFHGLTLLSCVVLPLVWCYILECLKEAQNGIRGIQCKLEKNFTAIVLVAAGQLTYERGAFYIVCMFVLGAAVILVKGGYDYGITSGRIKKRL